MQYFVEIAGEMKSIREKLAWCAVRDSPPSRRVTRTRKRDGNSFWSGPTTESAWRLWGRACITHRPWSASLWDWITERKDRHADKFILLGILILKMRSCCVFMKICKPDMPISQSWDFVERVLNTANLESEIGIIVINTRSFRRWKILDIKGPLQVRSHPASCPCGRAESHVGRGNFKNCFIRIFTCWLIDCQQLRFPKVSGRCPMILKDDCTQYHCYCQYGKAHRFLYFQSKWQIEELRGEAIRSCRLKTVK